MEKDLDIMNTSIDDINKKFNTYVEEEIERLKTKLIEMTNIEVRHVLDQAKKEADEEAARNKTERVEEICAKEQVRVQIDADKRQHRAEKTGQSARLERCSRIEPGHQQLLVDQAKFANRAIGAHVRDISHSHASRFMYCIKS